MNEIIQESIKMKNALLNPNDSQIIQQNKILMGGQTINLRAKQLIYVLASCIDSKSPHDEISISAKDFLDYINGNNKKQKWSDIYALTDEIFIHLNDNPILIKKPRSKEFEKINWLSRLGVKKGMITARFSTDIAEYFLYKQGLPYTKTMWDLRAYKSQATARFLDLFQKYHIKESGRSEISFEESIEDLKLFMGVQDKYPRMFDFEKRILKTAEKELRENDDVPYWFKYEKVKQGRDVKAITFTIYIRSEVLLKKVPNLKIFKNNHGQTSLFKEDESSGTFEMSKEQEDLVGVMQQLGLTEDFALRVINNVTITQAKGYIFLLEFGVNRNLAFTTVTKHCSFGELIGYEDEYIKHTLQLIERARLKRITDKQEGKTKKRTTPKEKRGGLAKKVFEERQHLSSFMESLSAIRNYREQQDLKNNNIKSPITNFSIAETRHNSKDDHQNKEWNKLTKVEQNAKRERFNIKSFKRQFKKVYIDKTREVKEMMSRATTPASAETIEKLITSSCCQWWCENT